MMVVPRQAAGRSSVAGRWGQRVSQAEVDVSGSVPGQRLWWADGVILDPVVLGVGDHVQGVGDLFEESFSASGS
jgi:hypothetical protein